MCIIAQVVPSVAIAAQGMRAPPERATPSAWAPSAEMMAPPRRWWLLPLLVGLAEAVRAPAMLPSGIRVQWQGLSAEMVRQVCWLVPRPTMAMRGSRQRNILRGAGRPDEDLGAGRCGTDVAPSCNRGGRPPQCQLCDGGSVFR